MLTLTVARVLARLMAYKDEFEVARLYSNGDFRRRLQSEFDGDFKLKFVMAPPLLSKRNAKGELVKRSFGGYMLPLFGWMTRFKGLRNTPFNVFGYSAERRMERQLIGDYRQLVERVLAGLTARNLAAANEIVRLFEDIKGFGHVKQRNYDAVMSKSRQLMNEYESRPPLAGVAAKDAATRIAS
jgi:indolepyruvate ferredoxin oxidoreductase